MDITLQRITECCGETYGVLLLGGKPRFCTIEDPWRDNQTGCSCIPKGVYTCEEYMSLKFGKTYIVKDVPGRLGILFHWGNTETDTEGCILVGGNFNYELGGHGILNSKAGFQRFLKFLTGQKTFQLTIK